MRSSRATADAASIAARARSSRTRVLSLSRSLPPPRAAAFVSDVCERVVADDAALHAALLPMIVDGDEASEVQTIGAQESALRLLLRVAPLQTALLDALFARLPELVARAADDDDAGGGGGGGGGAAAAAAPRGGGGATYWRDVPRLVLSQVRWLEHGAGRG